MTLAHTGSTSIAASIRATEGRQAIAYIIVADDDELVGELVRTTLTGYGHTVGVVANGDDALKAVAAKNPDLLILDCNMPERSGMLALREIRRSQRFFGLPVLMLTARRGEADVELAMREGADDYVKKPFDPEELAFRVDELLDSKRRHPGR